MNVLKPRRNDLVKMLLILFAITVPLLSIGYSALQTTLNIRATVQNEALISVTYDCGNNNTFYEIVEDISEYELYDNICDNNIVAGTGTGVSATPNVYKQTGWSLTSGGAKITGVNFVDNTTLYPYYEKLFTYAGTYQVIDDGSGDYRVKFLSSANLNWLSEEKVDLFLVGGGGGGASSNGAGGGGGYTTTSTYNTLSANTTYALTVGTGGATGANGNRTTLMNGSSLVAYADGGNGASGTTGGAGGSGGGTAAGGVNGNSTTNGMGQGITTCEFGYGTLGESTCDTGYTLYATGGTGAASGTAGTANTGNGGDGGSTGGTGGSGIIELQNNRENTKDSHAFKYTGEIQNVAMNRNSTCELKVWGAQGGNYNQANGGKGGYSTGIVSIDSDSNIYVVVGGKGAIRSSSKGQAAGGYNGGGYGYCYGDSGNFGGGGGGATHVAKVTGTLSSIGYDSFVTQNNGYIIAGGGGGNGGWNNHNNVGGAGGGTTGGDGSDSTAVGGTQTTGNAFAVGGNGTSSNQGGGGGGLYGGKSSGNGTSAGGGSGYIGGTLTGTTTADVRLGDGFATMSCYDHNTFILVYDDNGGTGCSGIVEVDADFDFSNLCVPTRSGYDFVGWYDSQIGGNQITSNSTITNSMVIYARWTAPNYGEYNGETFVGYHATLADAFGNSTEGNTIKALVNMNETIQPILDENKELTLDINGKTITTTSTLVNRGELTIIGSGTLTTSSDINLISNRGTLNLANSGNLTNTNTSTSRVVINNYATINKTGTGTITGYSNAISGSGSITMTAGKINVSGTGIQYGGSLVVEGDGNAEITGGTIENLSNKYASTIYWNSTGTLTIDGTTTVNVNGYDSSNPGAAVQNAGGGTIIINDGTFTCGANTWACVANNEVSGNVVTINGGTFNSTGGTTVNIKNLSTTNIYGGTFTMNTNSNVNAIHMEGGTLNLGRNDYAVDTTSPSITGNYRGIWVCDGCTLNFYDGVIQGPSSKSITGTVAAVPTGYKVQKTTVSSVETAILVPTASSYYTLTYNNNGGEGCVGTKSAAQGSTIGSLCVPTNDIYTFAGWYTDTNWTTQITSSTILTGNITVYAKWRQDIATITYNCNGGDGTAPSQAIIPINTNVNLTRLTCGTKTTTSGTNHELLKHNGWTTTQGGTPLTSYVATSNTILYATYEKVMDYTGNANIINDGNGLWTMEFTSSGTFTLDEDKDLDVYLIGGGQGGSNACTSGWGGSDAIIKGGGAGGQGGFITKETGVSFLAGTYTVTVGAGGAAGNPGEDGGISYIKSSSNAIIKQAPGGGSGATGYLGGALGGTAGNVHGNTTPYSGGDGGNATLTDFTGTYRGGGGGGGGGYWCNRYGENCSSSGDGKNGIGWKCTASTSTDRTAAPAGCGGGGYGNRSCGTGGAGGSGAVVIRNDRTDTNPPADYTVTYNCNGGTGDNLTMTITEGENAVISQSICGEKVITGTGTGTTSEAGLYYQAGWATTPNGSATNTITVNNDMTLYAVWEKSFTYSASYEVTSSGDTYRFVMKASGSMVVNSNIYADIFLVGGGGGGGTGNGGGGGGGGYTNTVSDQTLSAGNTYSITVGSGGAAQTAGSQSKFGSLATANGGSGGSGGGGGAGGSGGGTGGASNEVTHQPGNCNPNPVGGGNGGTNGAAGKKNAKGTSNYGTGQGSTTCEFGQGTYGGSCNSGVTMYAAGGNGGNGKEVSEDFNDNCSRSSSASAGSAGTANTGNGGNGGKAGGTGGAGGSGIVIIKGLISISRYTLTYNNNEGSGCTTKEIADGIPYGTLCTPTRSGYVFDGWWTSASGGTQVTSNTIATGNTTIVAHWIDITTIPPTCTVTVTSNDGLDGINTSVTCTPGGTACNSSINPTGDTLLTSTKTYTVYDVSGNSATCSVTVGTQRQRQTLECRETYGRNCDACGNELVSCTDYTNMIGCVYQCSSCWYCKGSQDQYWSTWSDVSSCTENSTTHCRTVYRGTPN